MRKIPSCIGWGTATRSSTRGLLVVLALIPFHPLGAAEEKNFCGNTSKAALKACRFESNDDYWIAVGKCNNEPDTKSCLKEAKEELRSKKEECREQFDARQEICGELGKAPYDPEIDPADFVTTIDNPYFPLIPGATFVYQGGDEVTVVEVTHETKEILGVTCIVVRDRVYVGGTWNATTKEVDGGEVIEDTLDYYGQDSTGNVWYFGEISLNFEDGELVNIEGSWTAGVDGAKPGVLMLADPQPGDFYRQEFLLGEAEDVAKVVSLGETVAAVFGGPYSETVKTEDSTPLEPGAVENKYYAAGVGLVLEVDPESGDRNELIDLF